MGVLAVDAHAVLTNVPGLLVVVVFVPNGSHCHGSGSSLSEGSIFGRSSVEKDVAGGDGDELVLSTKGLTRGQSRGCATGSEWCGRFRIGNGASGRVGAGAMVCFLVFVNGGDAEFGLSVRGGAGIANGHVVVSRFRVGFLLRDFMAEGNALR